jgi:soluble lytic murein transglycosylase
MVFLVAVLLSLSCITAIAQPVEAGANTRADDDNFLLLREAARQDDADKAKAIASRLPNYEIPSYVDYYRLKPRLAKAGDAEVLEFLKKYEGSAIADRLRNDWLLELGRRRDWAAFDQQFSQFVLKDDTQVKCYNLLSRAVKGQRVADEARQLLVYPPWYGDACNTLVATLFNARQFTTDDVLHQLRLAGETNATGPARRAAALLGASETRGAQAVDLPAVLLARGPGKTRAEHEIYIVALGRLARTSLKLAVAALNKSEAKLAPNERAIAWAAVALPASIQLAPEAADYWKKAAGAPLTNEQVLWKVRIALRQGDWKQVRQQIQVMPANLRNDPTWSYWLGRALQHEGAMAEALEQFQRIASQHSFYGQLALEEMGQPLVAPPPPAPLLPNELAAAASNPGLRRALKFFALRLRFEGAREWNWEVRKMGERELLAAAEFARQNDVLDRMVYTSEKTRSEHDYTQRFPTPHNDVLQPTTEGLSLDRAWVYGLIRQESRFNLDAQSRVGASGLMQVMPGTGKFVAKKIGLADYVHTKLSDLKTNITLGSNYLNMIMANFEGNQVLATAAYNAGPGRARNWRNKLPGPVEGAIFAETIPFSETRSYVKNVLANATNYAALFEKRPQSLRVRLGEVAPKAQPVNELP